MVYHTQKETSREIQWKFYIGVTMVLWVVGESAGQNLSLVDLHPKTGQDVPMVTVAEAAHKAHFTKKSGKRNKKKSEKLDENISIFTRLCLQIACMCWAVMSISRSLCPLVDT